MKKILYTILLVLIVAGTSYGKGSLYAGGGGVLKDTNCNQAKYFPLGTLCQDTDDGKLYKGTGAAVSEIAAGTTDAPTDAHYLTDQAEGGLSAEVVVSTIGKAMATSTNPGAIRFGRANADNTFSWLSDSDFRTAIGLAIGTNVQAYDADLTTWAGVTPGTGIATAAGNAVNATGGFLTHGNAAVTASVLTGYSSGAGTVAGTDTILQAINKLNGNDALKLPLAGGTITGNVTLDDGTGASPSWTFQDGTDETAVFSKVDSGYFTLTTLAADGFNILTGNLKVGNGTPGQTLNGEDGYIEGLFEVDGMFYADGGVTGALTGNASTASALASNPSDCGAGEFANAIAANGNLTCATPSGATLSDLDDLPGDTTDNNLIDQAILEGYAASTSPGFTAFDSDSAGADKTAGFIGWQYVDGADGAENSDWLVQIMQGGTLTTILSFDESDDQFETSKMINSSGGFTGALTGTASVAATGDSATSFFGSGTIEAARLPAASDTAAGVIELATPSETTTGTATDRAVTPDGLSGSIYGQKEIGWTVYDSDVATAVADGKQAAVIPASINGMNLIDVTCSTSDITGATSGATTVVLRRVRGATAADMTSTGVTIDYNAYTASDETVDTSNDDAATGDKIFVDVNGVSAGAAAKGLYCTAVFQLP